MTKEQIRESLTDRHALIATLYGECRSESLMGQVGVACVIANRVHADLHGDNRPDWWGEGFRAVCLTGWQFSCWWEKSTNAEMTYAFAESLLRGRVMGFEQLHTIADLVIASALNDPTRGANHYVTTSLLRVKPPKWALGQKPTVVIDHHAFFKLGA